MKKLFLIALVLCSCASPSVVLRKNIDIKTLNIFFEYGEQSIPMVSNLFERQLDDFIARHNGERNIKFRLNRASTGEDSTSIRIKLIGTQLVSPGQQTAGVLVSMVGLSLPFIMVSAGAPIYIFFYYFPKTRSLTEFSLSPDINGGGERNIQHVLFSPGFLKSPEKQISKHGIYFDKFLSYVVKEIEKDLRKS